MLRVICGVEIDSDHVQLIADTRILKKRKICYKVYESIEHLNDPSIRELYKDELKIIQQKLDFDKK